MIGACNRTGSAAARELQRGFQSFQKNYPVAKKPNGQERNLLSLFHLLRVFSQRLQIFPVNRIVRGVQLEEVLRQLIKVLGAVHMERALQQG